MSKTNPYIPNQDPRTLIVGIQSPTNKTTAINSYFEEFTNLVSTFGTEVEASIFLKIREIDSSYFLTKGKLDEVKELCVKHKIERVILSEKLTPKQERNLEDYFECPVMDRTGLILEIFEKSAHSAEGKKQVEIAKLTYSKTRLSGKGIHLSQQEGFTGVRGGPGETAKEKERRHIEDTVHKLKKQLIGMQKVRDTQCKMRVTRGIPNICIIGYTNSGKSTLLNTLTKSNVLAEDKLFATLDTTTRELYINHEKIGIISDTVGFIQQLPHHLIEAFKSTLSELQYADLLLHVVDISDENWQDHIKVVQQILNDLEVKKDMIYIFNKADKLENIDKIEPLLFRYEPWLLTSALSKQGLEDLIAYLQQWKKEHEIKTPEVQN